MNSDKIEIIPKHHKGGIPAIICNEQCLSYSQLCHLISQSSLALTRSGIKKNDHVCIADNNSIEYIVVYFGLLLIGALPCLLSIREPIATINQLIIDLNCSNIITSNHEILINNEIKANKIEFSELVNSDSIRNESTPIKPLDLRGGQIASIIFTSGSTSYPKAVAHDVNNHYFSALGSNEYLILNEGDRWLLTLPLYHVGGLSIVYRCFLAGATVVLTNRNKMLLDNIKNNLITHASFVPTQLNRLLDEVNNEIVKEKLKSLKVVLVGGAQLTQKSFNKSLSFQLPLYLSYGLTEMSSQVVTAGFKKNGNKINVESKILSFRKIKIKDGEILVKGETLFKGYFNKGKLDLPVDNEGWYCTSDLGVFNSDGQLKIIGRKDYMFISGGENINPYEIEKALNEIDGIRLSTVVPIESEEYGHRPVAFIDFEKTRLLNKGQITGLLADKLPKFKVPDHFYFWPECVDDKTLKINNDGLQVILNYKPQNLKEIT